MTELRLKNAPALLSDAMPLIMQLGEVARRSGPDPARLLVLVRVSQINGCSYCLDLHSKEARRAGVSQERLDLIAGWRDAACFTGAERAALALAECATRMSDRPDAVPDDVWNEAKRHFDEQALAALVFNIAVINLFNRFNVTLRAGPGAWTVEQPRKLEPTAA